VGKGTHKGVAAMEKMFRQASQNYTKPCFVLKCDIKSFFESIDHDILKAVVRKRVKDEDALWLVEEIIQIHYSTRLSLFSWKCLPIGNLTSQLFANMYLNKFDQFVKQKLKLRHYARYTDDFVIVSEDREFLEQFIPVFGDFLRTTLSLNLHPKKVSIRRASQGVDFLGLICFNRYQLLRTKTKTRMFRKLHAKVEQYNAGKVEKDRLKQSLQSYLGVLSHANAYRLSQKLLNLFWLWKRG
jgi:hypothetical protein